jgi:restriction endonuclease S subunit
LSLHFAKNFSVSTDNFVLTKNTDINLKYIFYYLSHNLDILEKGFVGSALQHLSKEYVKNISILLPPLDIQKLIVREIEMIDAYINELTTQINNENGLFVLYKKAKLHKIYEKLKNEYNEVELGEVCNTLSGGTPLKSKNSYYENGTIPWLCSGEIRDGFIYRSKNFITDDGLKNSPTKIISANSVLIAMYGATAGQVGILRFNTSINQAICAIIPNDIFVPNFLYYILKNRTSELVKLSRGGAQKNISQQIIKSLKIPLPPISVQEEVVMEIEKIDNYINEVRLELDYLLDYLLDYRKSVLDKLLNKKDYYEK